MHERNWTIRSILHWTADFFDQKGIPSARLDAEVLLAKSLNVERLYLYLNMDRPLEPQERVRYRELVSRRAQREPIAYITGQKEFWSVLLETDAGALIPRPETELLVEVTLRQLTDVTTPRILEIGTGTGAIAIALAKERPDASITAVDVSPDALEIAARNVNNADAAACVALLESDLFRNIEEKVCFDAICSNPPYVPTGDRDTLQPEIRQFEPWLALDGGPDGLSVIRELTAQAPLFIRDGGSFIFEFGDGQEALVTALLESSGRFTDIEVHPDLSGKPRVACAKVTQ
jgi:release factor glutamine methyltransferase